MRDLAVLLCAHSEEAARLSHKMLQQVKDVSAEGREAWRASAAEVQAVFDRREERLKEQDASSSNAVSTMEGSCGVGGWAARGAAACHRRGRGEREGVCVYCSCRRPEAGRSHAAGTLQPAVELLCPTTAPNHRLGLPHWLPTPS